MRDQRAGSLELVDVRSQQKEFEYLIYFSSNRSDASEAPKREKERDRSARGRIKRETRGDFHWSTRRLAVWLTGKQEWVRRAEIASVSASISMKRACL